MDLRLPAPPIKPFFGVGATVLSIAELKEGRLADEFRPQKKRPCRRPFRPAIATGKHDPRSAIEVFLRSNMAALAAPHRRVALIVHGGAGTLIDASVPTAMNGVSIAAKAGFSKLLQGLSALDAVEAAVKCLEDHSYFNAGRGSALTKKGTAEMDALICDGRNTNFGAVTGLTRVKNPVACARKVFEKTYHVFLCGQGAEEFAHSQGLEMRPPEYFVTEVRRKQLERALEEESTGLVVPADFVVASHAAKESIVDVGKGQGQREAREACKDEVVAEAEAEDCDHDTVGCVAIDIHGNLAAATSTGGLTAKMAGRIGDSPVFGGGGYADNSAGCCSTTGTGEFILRTLLAKTTADFWERLGGSTASSSLSADSGAAAAAAADDKRASEACRLALQRVQDKVGDPGSGLIFVAPDGGLGIAHSSPRMSFATAFADVPLSASAAPVGMSSPAAAGASSVASSLTAFNFACGYELPQHEGTKHEMHIATLDGLKVEQRPLKELEEAEVEAAKLACS